MGYRVDYTSSLSSVVSVISSAFWSKSDHSTFDGFTNDVRYWGVRYDGNNGIALVLHVYDAYIWIREMAREHLYSLMRRQ